MIKTLVERKKLTNSFDRMPGKKIEVIEYDTEGKEVNTKKIWG